VSDDVIVIRVARSEFARRGHLGGKARIAKYGADAVAANARAGLEARFRTPEERAAHYRELQRKSAESRRARKAVSDAAA
jgi:hypothetical protein